MNGTFAPVGAPTGGPTTAPSFAASRRFEDARDTPRWASPPSEADRRLLPRNIEAETWTLGSILQDPEAMRKAAEILRPEHFYRDAHSRIFAAALALFARNEPVDLITLTDELRRRGGLEAVGGPAALAALLYTIVEQVPTAGNVAYHVRIVREYARRRLLVEACQRAAERVLENGHGAEEPLEAIVADVETALVAVQEGPGARFTEALSDLLSVPDEEMPWLIEGLLVAVANGFIGGEPKVMKSWLALYLALCLSLGIPVFGRYPVPQRVRILYLQEEDGKRRIRWRIRKLLRGLGMEQPSDEFFRYSVKAGILLDDPTWIGRLRAELAAFRPAVVIADVFELMHSRDSDKRAELKPIFRALDRLREEFQVGFLLVDHFSKAKIGGSRRGGQRLAGTTGKHAFGENSLYLFPLSGKKNRVRVDTELKDAPDETFALTLEDTPDGGVAFQWEAEAEDREAEMKAKILAALEGLAPPGEWVTTKMVMEAAGVTRNTARKYLDLLVDEDRKLERGTGKVGKANAVTYRLTS